LPIPTPISEHGRAYLASRVARRINSLSGIETSADAMGLHGTPKQLRFDSLHAHGRGCAWPRTRMTKNARQRRVRPRGRIP
jgi:hypothetical protein